MERWHSSAMMKSNVSIGIAGLYLTSRLSIVGRGDFEAGVFVEVFGQLFAAQHRIEAAGWWRWLRGDGVEPVRGEVLDVVKLGELSAVVRRNELLKFGVRLPAEISAIDKEENVARAGVLDQPISECASGKVLPAPVAIWMSARGFASAKDFSRFVIASTRQARTPVPSYGCLNGISASRRRSVSGSSIHFASVSGR